MRVALRFRFLLWCFGSAHVWASARAAPPVNVWSVHRSPVDASRGSVLASGGQCGFVVFAAMIGA
eukprot:10574666-Alexandrium_andersonii.AAC.1